MAYLDQIVADDRAAEEIQYQQELARAQGRSGAMGFVATEVSPLGEVIAPGFDSSYQTQEQLIEQAKLEAAAQRYKGQQMYASLIKNGATPAEAIRLAGADLFANNPSGLVNAVVRSQPRPSPVQRMVPGRVPPAVRAEEDNIKQRLGLLRESLTGGRYGVVPKGEAKKQIEDQIAALEQERVRILGRPEFNPNIDQVGYARIRSGMESEPIPRPAIAPVQMAQAPATDDKVVVEKGGKQFRLPKSQLAEAKRDGYKLVE